MNDTEDKRYVTLEQFRNGLDLSYNTAIKQCIKNKELYAFKEKSRWKVPVEIYEEKKQIHQSYREKITLSYTIAETMKVIEKTRTYTHKLVSNGGIPGGFQYRNTWYVSKNEVHIWAELNNLNLISDSFTLLDISNKYNISLNIVRAYLYKNKEKFFTDNKKWYLHKDRIKELEVDLSEDITLSSGNYYSFMDIQKKFQVGKARAKNISLKYFQQNKLIQYNKSYYDKKIVDNFFDSLTELEKDPTLLKDYYSTKEIGKIMRITSHGAINLIRREKSLKVSTRYNQFYIKKTLFDNFYQSHPVTYSYTLGEIINLFECSRSQVTEMIKQGKFKNIEKVNGLWYIPKEQNKKFIDEFIYNNKRIKASLTITQLSEESGIARVTLSNLLYSGTFENAFFHKNIWHIPRQDIDGFYKTNKLLSNSLTTSEVAKRVGMLSSRISSLVRENKFPNAFKHKRIWRIPLEDIEKYEELMKKKDEPIKFNNTIAMNTMNEIINKQTSNTEIENTINLYIRYTKIYLSTTQSNPINKRMQFNIYMNLLKKFYLVLKKDIYLLSEKDLESLFKKGTVLTSRELRVLTPFYNFVCSERGINQDFTLKQVSSKENKFRSQDLEIYTPNEFNKIYNHVAESSLHVKAGMQHDYIAQMWAYVLLHCTTFMRGNDLLSESLKINLEVLNINNFNWFDKNQLNEHQIELVIKQLYYYFKNRRTSKTGELVTFLVVDSLREPLAYAIILSELHRRVNQKDNFFYTFYSRNYSTRRISGKDSHQLFFRNFKYFEDFTFKTLKMNRSIGTYLYNSIISETKTKSNLALMLTQKSRSHKSGDTTALYIQTTNKDGPISDVSFNLSRRGSFGWLYTSLLDFFTVTEKLSSIKKSEMINIMRDTIKPSELENYAEFAINHINKKNHVSYQSDQEKILSDMKKKQLNIINMIISYEIVEIKSIILKLSKGMMPSKIDHAQCLVSGSCPYPNQNNCLECEYVIPEKMILIQLNLEIKNVIYNIKNEKNILMLRKFSGVLIKLLIMLKEARQRYSDPIINTYIPLKELSKELDRVSNKLYLIEMD